MNYIYNKDSFENSVEVDNYPWGFRLKTKKRYWVETNKKGSRFMSCTLNPKNNQWCKRGGWRVRYLLIVSQRNVVVFETKVAFSGHISQVEGDAKS